MSGSVEGDIDIKLVESVEMNAKSQEQNIKENENAMMKENELLKADIMNLRNELENSLSMYEEQESALQEHRNWTNLTFECVVMSADVKNYVCLQYSAIQIY